MKRLSIIIAAGLIASCSQLNTSSSRSTAANTSWRAKMQACMLAEAQSKFQAGTLFTNSLSATADELVSDCTQKLALQSLGISDEAKSSAENIISNLKNLSSAQ